MDLSEIRYRSEFERFDEIIKMLKNNLVFQKIQYLRMSNGSSPVSQKVLRKCFRVLGYCFTIGF